MNLRLFTSCRAPRRLAANFLVEERAISEELRTRMLGWRYSGFSVHNRVRVATDDAEGRKKLAGYMLRAPLCLAKMSYDAASGTVIYRSKMHLGLKRYSSRSRGARAAKRAAAAPISSDATEALSEYASRAEAAWARLIRRVYESDRLECPKCKGRMRVIALIEDPVVVRTILMHLGRWQPKAVEGAPPVPPPRLGPRMRACCALTIPFPTSPEAALRAARDRT